MARTLMATKFTTAVSNLGKNPIAADIIIFGIADFFFLNIDNGMLCVLIRIALMRHF